jgi:tetratricopeptide (TPR) repeat protein
MIHTSLQILFAVMALFNIAISQSGRWIQPPSPDMPMEHRRDIALNAFAVGCAFEVAGDAAKALSAYRAALLYDDDPAIHLTAALCAAAADMPDEAAVHLKAATGSGRENPTALRMLADIHISTGQYDSAASVYRRLVASDSSDDVSVDMLAGLLENDHPDEAAELYRKLLDKRPSPETALSLARLYARAGHADSAVLVLESIRARNGDSDALLRSLTQLAAERGDWQSAAGYLRDLHRMQPDEVSYALQLAEALINTGEWAEPAVLMKDAAFGAAIGQEDKMQIGRLFFQRALEHTDALSQAIELFNELRRQFPSDWRPVWFHGATCYNAGLLADAAASFTAVLELTPGNIEAGNILARTCLDLQRYQDAVNAIEHLIEQGTATAESWTLLSYAWSQLGREGKALASLEQALQLDPSNLEVLVTLALSYDELGLHERSDPLYERAIRGYTVEGTVKDDIYYLLINNWAYALAQRNARLDQALMMSTEAVTHDPANSSYLDTRAWVLHQLGRHREALEWIQKAIAQQQSPVLFEHLGEILHALGRNTEARDAWTRGLELQPDNERLETRLKQLP